jgi:hypothetical protein
MNDEAAPLKPPLGHEYQFDSTRTQGASSSIGYSRSSVDGSWSPPAMSFR